MAPRDSLPDPGDWRAAFDGAPDAHYLADGYGRVLAANAAAVQLHRRSRSELEGETFFDLGLVDRASWRAARRRLDHAEATPFTPGVRPLPLPDGGSIQVEFRVTRIRGGEPRFLLGVARDVTAERDRCRQLEHLAFHDTLTGLGNLAGFRARLRELVVHGLRDSRELWAVLLLDLDHFKNINDSHGHAEGDRILCEVATRIQATIRRSDHAFRVGGDEFAVVARHLGHPEDAAQVAQNLVDATGRAVRLSGTIQRLGTSIGIACYPRDGDTAGQLLRRADSALYAAKSLRCCYRFWARVMDQAAADRLILRRGVARALERDELSVEFQPIHDCADPSGRPAAVEALLRWGPAGGPTLSAGSFVGLAEEIRVIRPIGEWVLGRACAMGSQLRRATGRSVPVGVNLSASELGRDDLLEVVRTALDDAKLAPEGLQLEFTAGDAAESGETGLERLRRLADLGVSLALDDVGAGQFPYATLRELPLATLKIDGALVRQVTESEIDARIVGSLVELARAADCRSLAEAVETPAQLRRVRELGCELVQGYATSPPLSADDLVGRFSR